MAERRKWDRPARELPVGGPEPKAEDADPVLQKQRQYIKILEERNRLRKRLAETQQQRKKDRLQEREDAFVTTFNVPPASGASAVTASRKSKSSTTQLPSRMAAFDSDHAQCKSAPAIGLGYANASADKVGSHKPRASGRAKWSKPQGPMTLAVEVDREGKTQYCLAEQPVEGVEKPSQDAKDVDRDVDSYLEDSFEEFESDESGGEEEDRGRLRRSRAGSLREQVRDIVIEEEIDADDDKLEPRDGNSESVGDRIGAKSGEDTLMALESSPSAPSSSPALSDTTRDLLGMIEHLSRTKQRELVEVLHKFQSSQKRESDMRELRNSIGDPEIWRQLTTNVLAPHNETPSDREAEVSTRAVANCLSAQASAVDQVLEEHRRWEEQYANEMRQRLAKERETKEAVLREAEARRMAMLKQLEDEEREIERLMELKRRERLAQLRAFEQQLDESGLAVQRSEAKLSARTNEPVGDKHGGDEVKAAAAVKSTSEIKEQSIYREIDVKTATATVCDDSRDIKDFERLDDTVADAKSATSVSTLSVVPPLNLAASTSSSALSGPLLCSTLCDGNCEVRVKLVSTWSGTRVVGLTQISVYDSDGAEMDVDPASLRLYEHLDGKPLPKSSDMVRGLRRLFNGIAHTNSEQDMWLGRLPDSGTFAWIGVFVP